MSIKKFVYLREPMTYDDWQYLADLFKMTVKQRANMLKEADLQGKIMEV